MKEEKTLIIIKPDALQRNLFGEIVHRFERKGLKIIGLKMMELNDAVLDEHYAEHKHKPHFGTLKRFMKLSPVVVMVLSGMKAVSAVRFIVGATKGYEADAGTIRGDFSISQVTSIVHTSDSLESAEREIKIFFRIDELFEYRKIDFEFIYGEDERSG